MKRKILIVVAMMYCLNLTNPMMVRATELIGDGYEVVEDFETAKSEKVSCSLAVQAVCPEGFGLNCYVLLMDEQGEVYRVSLNVYNDYLGQIYLAPGKYQVTEVSVFDDYKQEYPFIITEGEFTLSENETKTLSFTMRDYEKIKKEIAEKTSGNQNNMQSATFSDTQLYETGLEGVLMQGTGTLYYGVEHIGTGAGTMEASGYATGDYDVVVKIVKSGVLGEAVFQISLDGGKSFIGQDVVTDSSRIGDAGLILYFKTEQDTMEFLQGDEYIVKVPETFSVIASKASTANVVVTGHPLEEHDFVVTILSSGGLGKSRFTVESTKGTAINVTDVIPENGNYELEDDMTLVFSDSTSYERGLTYSVTVKSNDDTVNYTPLYVLLGIVATGATAALSVMGSRREKDSEYRIRKYQWRKEEKEYEES